MTRISDLSQDLIEEILSRVPLTSQRAATSTCRQWNGSYKDESFTKKHRGKAAHDTMEIMVYDSRVRLVRVDLQVVLKRKQGLVELSKKLIGQLNHIMVSDDDGLLLSLPKNGMVKSDPVVWNPYLGQVRWIKPRKQLTISEHERVKELREGKDGRADRAWYGRVGRTIDRTRRGLTARTGWQELERKSIFALDQKDAQTCEDSHWPV
ncbi:hypothetical protein F2Q68_00017194 [Brassica cretica]|uniref:F-box domain-containing protein n=1 Tax=Brassica cretica TaxID=69181 RepID=A0A8S9HFZ7_BRACR|nr:hypothetical protein F2Q68_00017194 [Brassica cretica]